MMKIKTAAEIQAIDQRLGLIGDSDWTFLDVSGQDNADYYNDLEQAEVYRRGILYTLRNNLINIVLLVALLGGMLFFIIKYYSSTDINAVNELNNMQTANEGAVSQRIVDGVSASGEELLQIRGVIDSYVGILRTAKSYDALYGYCSSTSTFADTYNSNVNRIKVTYDMNDCNARALRSVGARIDVDEVVDVLVKDNVYYCYVRLTYPTEQDMKDLVFADKVNASKQFAGKIPTEEQIYKYFLKALKELGVNTTSNEVCLKFVKSKDGFKIKDDSIITSNCINAYTEAIEQISLRLKDGGTDLGR